MATLIHSVYIPSVAALHYEKRGAIEAGQFGIDIALKTRPDGTTLCFIKDTEANDGASATNAMYQLLSYIHREIFVTNNLAFSRAAFIQIDSVGDFDYVTLERNANNKSVPVWRPVNILNHSRTREAVELIYGDDATELLNELNVGRKNKRTFKF